MDTRIANLTIEGFRGFRELKLAGLGRVNLITGRNNMRKSSLLEEVRILASDSHPATIHSILAHREENVSKSGRAGKTGVRRSCFTDFDLVSRLSRVVRILGAHRGFVAL